MKRDPVRTYRDGREVCDLSTAAGKREYRFRLHLMWNRQKGICCLHGVNPDCPGKLHFDDAVFEHESPRGMGGAKRDDRIVDASGCWMNGAAHAACNAWKGSRRIKYNGKSKDGKK